MFAAHINGLNEQSVSLHCKKTAEYASKSGEKIGIKNTMYLAGLLHDLGKFTNEFNEYIHSDKKNEKKINHSSAGAKYLEDNVISVTFVEKLTKQLVNYAIVSHHGLNDCLSFDGHDKYFKRINPDSDVDYDEVLRNSKQYLSEFEFQNIFSSACREIDKINEKIISISNEMGNGKRADVERCFLYGCLSRFVLSILMDGDRRDTAEYMLSYYTEIMSNSEKNVFFNRCLDRLEYRLNQFEIKNNIDILRKEMSDQCGSFAENHNCGIYKLSIPTGGGKTYSSMRFALKVARKYKKDRIFYVAPFLSILEQNANDLKNIFDNSSHILEHHSNVVFQNSEDGETIKKHELLEDNWESPMIFTTMVRFLDVLFGKKTTDIRRMHQFKNSVIIIDEAQAIPVRFIHMFNTAMNFLASVCNATIVLCTATQPIFESVKRPLLYSKDVDIISNIEKYAKAFKRVDIVVDYANKQQTTEDLCNFLVEKIDKNALIILNTKTAVRKLYDSVKTVFGADYEIIQLTTYMCAQHRLDTIDHIKKVLRKNKKIICISTQLIEAGVDISFDTVFRSLSGLDNIIQAAGRCNRNGLSKINQKTYVIQYLEEKVSMLEDVAAGQKSMLTRLDYYNGEDLLLQKSIDSFYKQYYFDRQDIMDAPCCKYDSKFDYRQTLYSLLSLDLFSRNEYRKNNGHPYPNPLSQSFKTACSLFSPIEKTNTIGVIVYYKNSKILIDELYNKKDDIYEVKKILKQLQRYTVNMSINSKMFKDLESGHFFESKLFDFSILILTESNYSLEKGISTEMTQLII